VSTISPIGGFLGSLEPHVGCFSIEALCGLLKPEWVGEVLERTRRASQRMRGLPADLVVWMVIAMALFRSLSIANVWARLRTGFRGNLRKARAQRPSSSAMTQARDRLGLKPLVLLFRLFADLLRSKFAPQDLWKGLKQVALDGSSGKVPDSKANRRKFGGPKSHRGKSGYPFLRFVTLVGVQTHLILAAAVGAWSTSEVTLVMSLVASIEPGSLVLLDRGFLSYWLLWRIVHGRHSHFLVRGKRRLKIKKRQKLAPGDWLAEALLPRHLRGLHPVMPKRWTVRLIHYRIPGYRPSYLITSLLDPVAYPAEDLIARYHARWEQELAYDEMKTHLVRVPVVFRSKTPKRVLQEFFALLIAYNLVRATMVEAAVRADISPLKISFVDAVERIKWATFQFASAQTREVPYLYRELLDEIASCRLPARRRRRYPRAVKVKMSSFPLKRPSPKRAKRA
jgi:hypothetical protein